MIRSKKNNQTDELMKRILGKLKADYIFLLLIPIPILLLIPLNMLNGAPIGAEFQINSYSTSHQRYPVVATDSIGNFVVVWQSEGQDGSSSGIYARQFNNTRQAQGNEFRVNTYTTGAQSSPALAMNSTGDFVVVWQSDGQDGSSYGIYAQQFNNTGQAQGSEFQVNTYTTGSQGSPVVAMDSNGNFVIVWQSDGQDGSSYGIYARQFDSTGQAQGSEFRVNTYTTGVQNAPVVAMNSTGDFVVVWESDGQDGSSYGIYAQRYNYTGQAQGDEFRVNTNTTGAQGMPAAAMDSNGNFVVIWQSDGQDGGSYGIYAQQYNNTGQAQGDEFRVNTYTTGDQIFPAAAMDSNGNFVVIWQSDGQDGSSYGNYAREYNYTGQAQGSEFQVNTYTTGAQNIPAVAIDLNSNYVVVWQSDGQDENGYGIFAQSYDSQTFAEFSTNILLLVLITIISLIILKSYENSRKK
ncbi:MAG: hypothetical protein ACFFCQ_12405 [Promethearchaeota archaeon]